MQHASDNAFVPKVWQDHALGYFDKTLGIASFALENRTLTAAPGTTLNFPYWNTLGPVEDGVEGQGMQVDKLSDDSFQVTITEKVKSVGWTDHAIRTNATGPSSGPTEAEAQRQLGILYAERVDSDCLVALNSAYVPGKVATTAAEKCNIRDLLISKVLGFGDKQNKAVGVIMHSMDFANMLSDSTAGFLHANATMPMFGRANFMGMLLDCAVFVTDEVPETVVDGKKAWYHYYVKQHPFGLYLAEDLHLEKDRDILTRENVVASSMWYGTLSLHGKVSAKDYRVCRGLFSSGISA